MTVTWVIKIAWSGDSAGYTGTYDNVTPDVLEIRDSFIGITDWKQRIARVGTLDLVLDNGWRNNHSEYGLYTPSNTAGSLYGDLNPMTPMEIVATQSGTDYNIFTGYVENIQPRGEKEVRLRCVDGIEPLTRARPRIALQVDKTGDQVISTIIDATYTPRAAAGVWNIGEISDLGETTVLAAGTEGRNLETGLYTWEAVGHTWQPERTPAYQMLRDTVQAEWGLLWADTAGNIVFKNGHWALTDSDTDATVSTGIVGVEPLYGANEIVNRVDVTVTPRESGSPNTLLGEMNDTPSLRAGETLKVEIRFRDQTGGARIAASAVDTPGAGADYTANSNSDGSGKGLTGNLTMSVDGFSTSALVSMTNGGTEELYVTKLQLTGTPIYIYDAVTRYAEDAGSELSYTRRDMMIRLSMGEDVTFAQALADYLLTEWKDPRFILKGLRLVNVDDTLETQCLAREIGDVVIVQHAPLGMDAKYRIISKSLRASGRKIIVKLGLIPFDDIQYWLLGVVDYGELGETTYLGPL